MKNKTFLKTILSLTILLVFLSGCVSPSGDTGMKDVSEQDTELPDTPEELEDSNTVSEANETETGGEKAVNNTENPRLNPANETEKSELGPVTKSILSEPHHLEKIRVGAFNVQVFGVSKASDLEVMDTLAKIVRTYDVVAIQEIRDKSQTALPELVELVNADGAQYSFIVSERLGRTTSKEQYAYVYDSTSVRPVGEALTYPEPEGTDPFHREPYIASFETLGGDFDIILITVHTDPDEATEEINALVDVAVYAREIYPEENDFMIMGDFNADGSYFDEDGSSSLSTGAYSWLINNSADTTTKASDCTYDRIVISNSTTSKFAGNAGVFRYDLEYNLTYDETVAVSDHYPVYAEFWYEEEEIPARP